MSYTPFYPGGWQSGESGGTPITPEALIYMENGIAGAHAAINAGYGSTMPYLNGETSNFLTLLQQAYSAMGDRTTAQIVFSDSALGGSIRWWGTIWRQTEGYGVLMARSTNGVRIQRTLSSGAWGAWEYENPPMEEGKEFRTTERWLGKPVYAQLLNMGEADGTTFKVVKNVPATSIVRADVICGGAMRTSGFTYAVTCASGISVSITAEYDLTGQQVYVTAYYVK